MWLFSRKVFIHSACVNLTPCIRAGRRKRCTQRTTWHTTPHSTTPCPPTLLHQEGQGGCSYFSCFSPPSHRHLSFHHRYKYCPCFPGFPSVTWLHTHSPQPQETELWEAHDPQQENLSDEHPMFACTVTFNPREYSGLPDKTAVQPGLIWYCVSIYSPPFYFTVTSNSYSGAHLKLFFNNLLWK